MKHLKDIVTESFFDDDPKQFEKIIRAEIKQFLKNNYSGASKCKISKKPNEDGKYVVDCKGALSVKNTKIMSLTNDMFVFGSVNDNFDCSHCVSLTSLKGAPEKVGGGFNCFGCESLTSLEGASKEVHGDFLCGHCKSLISLNGSPQEVGGDFKCYYCYSLKSLEGAPIEVGGIFDCSYCDSLTSLKGAPKWIGVNFICGSKEQKFDEKEIRKYVSHIGGKLVV